MTTTHVQMPRVALLVSMVAKTMPIGAAAKRCGIPDRVAVEVIRQHGGADRAKLGAILTGDYLTTRKPKH